MAKRTDPKLTDEEVKTLARQMLDGSVFTSLQVDSREWPSVWMPLGLMDRTQALRMQRDRIVMLYEHMSQASPIAVNGHPTFFSVKMVNEADAERVLREFNRMQEALQA